MTTYPARTRRWTRGEYERLIGVGVFRADEAVELLGGELVVGEPQGSAHYTAIGLVEDTLREALGPVGVGVDLLLYSEAEFEKRRDWCSTPVYWAVREGRVLHESAAL